MHQQSHPSALLQLTDVHKRYGPVQALAGLSLCLQRGEVLALLGPNGAGKTTAVRAALGLAAVDAGHIEIGGHPPGSLTARLNQGVMLQAGALPESLSVREQLRVAASYHARPASLDALIEECDLDGLLDRRYGQLSGGQKRRAQFALALVGQPALLILDEPTSALDPTTRQRFWRTIRARVAAGMGVLLTTHDLAEAEAVAQRVAVVASGRLLGSGTPTEVRTRMEGSVVRFRSRLATAELRALAGATEVQLDQQRARIRTRTPEALLRAALAADPDLCELEVSQPSLEDAVNQWLQEAA